MNNEPVGALHLKRIDIGDAARFEALDMHDAVLASVTLRRRIGLEAPRPWFHQGTVVHAAKELGLFQKHATLTLCNDLTGADELTDWDGDDPRALRAVLDAACEAAAAQAAGDETPLITELSGPRDGSGQSPFWQGLGRHFYGGDPDRARARFGRGWTAHVAELLPRHAVYMAFLPAAARDAAGQAASEFTARLTALRDRGFRPSRYLCVDDGGPVWWLARG